MINVALDCPLVVARRDGEHNVATRGELGVQFNRERLPVIVELSE